MDQLYLAPLWYLAFVFSTTIHEASHAYAAYKMGDDTAYQGGQVTLSPFPHIRREPFGMIIIPVVTFLLGGWMIGWASTPYNSQWATQYPKRSAKMALAGPAANLLLIVVSGFLIRLGIWLDIFAAPEAIRLSQVTVAAGGGFFTVLAIFISILFSLNMILLIFNLIPVPPLDGSGAVPLFLSDSMTTSYVSFIRNPAFNLLGLLIAWRVFEIIQGPAQLFLINMLYPGMGYH